MNVQSMEWYIIGDINYTHKIYRRDDTQLISRVQTLPTSRLLKRSIYIE